MFTTSVAAARLGRELPELESVVDQAIAASAALMCTMANARQIEGVSASAGQVALLRLHKAQQSLIDAASDIQRVHGELLKLNHEVHGGPTHDGECPKIGASIERSAAA